MLGLGRNMPEAGNQIHNAFMLQVRAYTPPYVSQALGAAAEFPVVYLFLCKSM